MRDFGAVLLQRDLRHALRVLIRAPGIVGDTRSTLDGRLRQTVFIPRPQRPGAPG